jgi:protein-tyrosine phosphatase
MMLRIALASLLAVSTFAHADVTNLSCVQTGDTEYKLTYSFTARTHGVQIFASTSPEPTSKMQSVLTTRDTAVTVHAGSPKQRIYFFLKADSGETREVSIRHLPLEGTPNFRDLGGYETTDGHFVRWGLLYRAGVLTYLTPADMKYLGQMGVRVICDFRTKQENDAAAETWIPGAKVDFISLPIGGNSGTKNSDDTLRKLVAGNPTLDQLRTRMTESYGSFAFTYAPQYAKVFTQLEHDSLPLLYHCAGGKDRTGVFSAFLLLTLGVPEKTVLQDYALTNKYLLNDSQSEATKKTMAASGNSYMAQLSPEQRNVLIAADPAYLESALRQIIAKYGSFDNYRRQVLQVSDEDAAKLRNRLLMQ